MHSFNSSRDALLLQQVLAAGNKMDETACGCACCHGDVDTRHTGERSFKQWDVEVKEVAHKHRKRLYLLGLERTSQGQLAHSPAC